MKPRCGLGVPTRAWSVLRCRPEIPIYTALPAQFSAELKFRVVDVDPSSGEVEGDAEGFAEEYPLEDIEVTALDFMEAVLLRVSQC